jgi:hypothetical protein
MKKTLVLACCLALVAVAAFAQAPSQHRVTLAEIMAPAPTPAPAVAAQSEPVFLASNNHRGGINRKVTCSANCGGTTVTCQSSSAGTCVAVDQVCPGTQGYVSCDGATTYCPACGGTQICTPGTTRYIWDGSSCCDEGGKAKEEQQCSSDGTAWVYTGNFICMGLCGPRVP